MFRQLALNELSRIYLSDYYNEQTNIEDETQLIYLQANDVKKTEVALPKCLAESHSSKLKDEIKKAITAMNLSAKHDKPKHGETKDDAKKIIVKIGKPSYYTIITTRICVLYCNLGYFNT